jgi:alkanesulfonate monooxygenase SsuD/methylene tetrahydromethanopterin reductase-like flavin-dependent oxidoreductase (luciferase family)
MPDGGPTTIARIVEVAKRAEDLGFDAVAVSDHLFLDIEKYGGPPGRYETPEAFALLGALAAGTDRIGLETLVLCVPFRNPAVLAEQVRSLQELSDGRFTCGLGAGWYEPEFKHAGIPFGTPGSRIAALREAAAVLHSAEVAPIWIGGKVRRSSRRWPLTVTHGTCAGEPSRDGSLIADRSCTTWPDRLVAIPTSSR